MKPHVLVGKTLTGIKIADDKEALLFQTTEGDIVARADGHCCSRSWVEHVELPALGFPALVTAAEDIDYERQEDDPELDCVRFYGFKIATDRGEILVDYRNSSNGYYGGSLVWPGEHHYGGVFGQNNSSMVWTDLAQV